LNKANATREFQLDVNIENISDIQVALGTCTLLIMICVIIYVFKYDIKILFHRCFRMLFPNKNFAGKYNFFFLYDFENTKEFRKIYEIVLKVESRGFSSYFYHRDQTYGKNIIEELGEGILNSDIIVIWGSPQVWSSEICNICIHMLKTRFARQKRVYAMTINRHKVIELCKNELVLLDSKSYFSPNLYFLSPKHWKIRILSTWLWHDFSSWLISSLPLRSI